MSTTKQQNTLQRLRSKFRLVILNDDTLEEKFSFRLSELNIYIFLSTIFVVLVFLIVSLIVFTPLKEYIPGYGDTSMRRNMFVLAESTDSIEQIVRKREAYLNNIKSILQGEIDTTIAATEGGETAAGIVDVGQKDIDLEEISEKELALRQEVEQEGNYDLFGGIEEESFFSGKMNMYFFAPIKGYVSDGFDAEKEHFGVDIVAPENEPVKSIADGMVILSSWTMETGHVIGVQHANDLVSFYKHNSVLLKKVGNFVKAGDVIAVIGNSGEESTGPHLHLELWHNQTPVNPLDYIIVN